jgi:Ca2+-binding EF-hand superfamily protein
MSSSNSFQPPKGPTWNEFECATSNKKYWYNRITKETIWEGGEPPPDLTSPRKKTGRATKVSFLAPQYAQEQVQAQSSNDRIKARKKTGTATVLVPGLQNSAAQNSVGAQTAAMNSAAQNRPKLGEKQGSSKLAVDLELVRFVIKIQSAYRTRLALMTVDLVKLDHTRTLRLFKFRLDFHLRRNWPTAGVDAAVGLFFDTFDIEAVGTIDSTDLGAVANCVGCHLNHREQQEVACEITHKSAAKSQDISREDFVLWYLYMDGAHSEEHFRTSMRDAISKWGNLLVVDHKLRWAFEELDLDSSGHIDSAEFDNLFRCLGFEQDGTLTKRSLNEVLGKEEMSKDEFIVWWKEASKYKLKHYTQCVNHFLQQGDKSTAMEERMKILFHHFEVDDSECPKVTLARLAKTLGYELTDLELDQCMQDCHLDEHLKQDHNLGINMQELVAWLSQKDGCDLGDPLARQNKGRRAGLLTDPAEIASEIQKLETADARLVNVSLIIRHGSRGPNKSELKPFLKLCVDGEPTDSPSMISRAWSPNDLEQLTPMGQEQVAQIASWFGTEYLEGRHPELIGAPKADMPTEAEHLRPPGEQGLMEAEQEEEPTEAINDLAALGISIQKSPASTPRRGLPAAKKGMFSRQQSSGRTMGKMLRPGEGTSLLKAKFRVSVVSRTMESAKSFSKNFASEFIELSPLDDKHANETFRAYKKDQIYLYHMKKDRGSPIFTMKANEHLEFLKDIKRRAGCYKTAANEEELLKDTCYFRHMIECEEAWVSPRGYPKKPVHEEVTKLMTAEEKGMVCDLGVWVWNRRFFNSFGDRIGGRFLKEVLDDAVAAPSRHENVPSERPVSTQAEPKRKNSRAKEARRVGVYVCHDYSILVLLSAFGLPCYPSANKLGFACHLLLETYELPDGRRFMKLLLNSNPYHEAGSNKGEFVQTLCDRFTLVGFVVDVAKFVRACTFLKHVMDSTHTLKATSSKRSSATEQHAAAVRMQSIGRGINGRKEAAGKKEAADVEALAAAAAAAAAASPAMGRVLL